jgi:hypothetical protein
LHRLCDNPAAQEGIRNPCPRRNGVWAPAFAGTTLVFLLLTALGAHASDLAVDVVNASEPTLCAEKDNVSLKLVSGAARRFTVEAIHPAYTGTIVVDRYAPDFRNCDMSGDPAHKFAPRRVTLYETDQWQLVGHTFPSFWRPTQVPVRVGDRVETGLHLLQLWTRFQERAEEVLVLYPADGYWRARPLPPAHLRWSAYGSSFLVGPVSVEGRPVVNLKEVAFDPAAMTFALTFAAGGRATVAVKDLTEERLSLEVAFDRAIEGQPFAALRSMYVTEFNADVARIAAREEKAKAWREEPIMAFGKARATDVWMGRLVPSRHNTSAPDMMFNRFRGAPAPLN